MDDKVCQTLDIKFENEDEEKVYGGEYEYLGTIALSNNKRYPFFKQVNPLPHKLPQLMYHNRNTLVATVSNV